MVQRRRRYRARKAHLIHKNRKRTLCGKVLNSPRILIGWLGHPQICHRCEAIEIGDAPDLKPPEGVQGKLI